MRKFLAVVKHEYRKIVLKWTFLVSTLLLPLISLGFAFVPMLIFSIKGEPTRIAIVDPSGKIAPRIRENLTADKMHEKGEKAARESLKKLDASTDEKLKLQAQQAEESYILTDYDTAGKSLEEVRRELNQRIIDKQLDAYIIVPPALDGETATVNFYSRKAGDFVTKGTLEDAVNEAVYSQRLADAKIDESRVKQLSQRIDFKTTSIDERGDEKNLDWVMGVAFVLGLVIYITLAIYGQMIMGAVVEEKETRIAEILFSSARPFQLLMGKLVGVGLAGLTQLAIWLVSASAIAVFFVAQMAMAGQEIPIPSITPAMIVYFLIFFLLGFFIYASIFALIGSVVTTVQEGGQFAMPPIIILLIGFYFSFVVIRDPNSTLSFWVSVAPFMAPITMPVRIVTEMPPLWQIGLAILLNGATIAGLIWIAARVYRVGMLMYGKRATIPEVWRWIRKT